MGRSCKERFVNGRQSRVNCFAPLPQPVFSSLHGSLGGKEEQSIKVHCPVLRDTNSAPSCSPVLCKIHPERCVVQAVAPPRTLLVADVHVAHGYVLLEGHNAM